MYTERKTQLHASMETGKLAAAAAALLHCYILLANAIDATSGNETTYVLYNNTYNGQRCILAG